MIPRRFWILIDLALIALAVWFDYRLLPLFHHWFEEGGLLYFAWPRIFSARVTADRFRPTVQQVVFIYLAIAPAGLLALDALGGYRPIRAQSWFKIVLSGVIAPLLGLSLMATVVFGLHSGFGNRVFTFSFILLSSLMLAASRLALRGDWIRRESQGLDLRNRLLICSRRCLPRMIQQLSACRDGFRLFGYLDLDDLEAMPFEVGTRTRSEASSSSGSTGGHGRRLDGEISHGEGGMGSAKRLGSVGLLSDILINEPIHEVVAAVSEDPGEPQGWSNAVVSCCDQLGITLTIVPYDIVFREEKALRLVRSREDFSLAGLLLKPAHAEAEAMFAKRVFDFVVASILLVALSPLLAVIALAIKLSEPKLPAIYRFCAIGQNGKPITTYKFRTMVHNAEVLKTALMDRNEMKGPVFKITNDPRITPLGRPLRKFSLDELPQLFSVVTGDLSLVGPRPGGPHEFKRYEFWHKRRLSIKPGITCLWQVNGRNTIADFDDWVRMDLNYIDNWSFWLDLKILLKTVWVVAAGTGK